MIRPINAALGGEMLGRRECYRDKSEPVAPNSQLSFIPEFCDQ